MKNSTLFASACLLVFAAFFTGCKEDPYRMAIDAYQQAQQNHPNDDDYAHEDFEEVLRLLKSVPEKDSKNFEMAQDMIKKIEIVQDETQRGRDLKVAKKQQALKDAARKEAAAEEAETERREERAADEAASKARDTPSLGPCMDACNKNLQTCTADCAGEPKKCFDACTTKSSRCMKACPSE